MALRHALIAVAAPGVLLGLMLALAFALGPAMAGGRAPGTAAAATAALPAATPRAMVGAPGEHRHRRGDGAGEAALGALRLHLTPALARAYAAAGALLDGRRHDLAGLDAATLAELARAEELLAYAAPLTGARQATRLGDGTTMQLGASTGLAGAAASGPAGATAVQASTTGASARHDAGAALPTAAAAPAAGSGNANAVPDAAVADRLDGSARAPIPISGDATKQLTLPGAWLAIPYQPALVQGQPLVIENQSGGEYAISLVGDDFGEVRLDGGLVVPGRYYRINGVATITSPLPVGVHIRPLTAVGTYYDQPLLMPGADG